MCQCFVDSNLNLWQVCHKTLILSFDLVNATNINSIKYKTFVISFKFGASYIYINASKHKTLV